MHMNKQDSQQILHKKDRRTITTEVHLEKHFKMVIRVWLHEPATKRGAYEKAKNTLVWTICRERKDI